MPHTSRLTSRFVDFFIPLLILLPMAWALLAPGLPNTADMSVHFIRSVEMFNAWQEGLFLPRWSANLGYGYGIPLFNYAPPLPYYSTALLHTLGLPMESALKGTLLMALLVAVFGSYWMARDPLGPLPGAVTAAAYLYAPIRLRELFIQGNVGQFIAWVFLPWAFWGLIQYFRTGHRRYGVVVTFALAATLLSHNVVALLLGAFLALLGLLLTAASVSKIAQLGFIEKKQYRKTHTSRPAPTPSPSPNTKGGEPPSPSIGGGAGGGGRVRLLRYCEKKDDGPQEHSNLQSPISILQLGSASGSLQRPLSAVLYGVWGLALTAWFWMPALLEGEYIQLSRIVASDFRARFVPFAELIALSPPLDRSAINPYFPLTLGAVQVWLGLIGLLCLIGFWIWSRRVSSGAEDGRSYVSRLPGLFFAIVALGSGFMALSVSEFVWNRLPFVSLFEFPARWHGFTAVGLSWLGGVAIYAARWRGALWERIAAIMAVILLIGSALVNLYPHHLPPGRDKTSPSDVVRFEVRTKAVGTTSLGEFNPAWVTDPLYDSPLVEEYAARASKLASQPINRIDPSTLPEGGSAETVSSAMQSHRFHVRLPTPANLTLRIHYFPGWQATLDGVPQAINPAPGSGLITLALPAGEHDLDLTFRETPLRLVADGISLVAWLLLVVVGGRWVLELRKATRSNDFSRSPRRRTTEVVTTSLAVMVVMVAYWGFSEWFTLVSPPDKALPASMPLHVDWADQLRLLGIDEAPEVVKQGDKLTLVAYWRAWPDLKKDYAVFLHLDDPNGQTIATVDQHHPSELPTSDWPSTLYLRNPLTLRVPPDAAPMRYRLRVGFYDPQSQQRLKVGPNGDSHFEVGQVWVEAQDEISLPPAPSAQFGKKIRLRSIVYDKRASVVTLYWQTSTPITQDYSIFLHLRDEAGHIIGQVDGTPYDNRYRTSDWRPEQLIKDVRSVAVSESDGRQIRSLAIGVYLPATGERLPATDDAGQALADNMLLVPAE